MEEEAIEEVIKEVRGAPWGAEGQVGGICMCSFLLQRRVQAAMQGACQLPITYAHTHPQTGTSA